jgi:hypothetical protein
MTAVTMMAQSQFECLRIDPIIKFAESTEPLNLMAAGKPGQTVKQTDFRAKAQRFSPLVAFLPVHPAGRFHFLSTEMSPYPEGFSEERKLWQKKTRPARPVSLNRSGLKRNKPFG